MIKAVSVSAFVCGGGGVQQFYLSPLEPRQRLGGGRGRNEARRRRASDPLVSSGAG